jgi:hypothetical protein
MKLGVSVIAGLLVLGLVAGVGSGRPPQAQELPAMSGTGRGTAEGFTPDGGATRAQEGEPELVSAWLRIPGTTFKPRQSDVDWGIGGNGGGIMATAGDTSTWFNAPVYLPHGSTVTMVRVYVHDTNGTHNCWAYFTVYDLYGEIQDEWGLSSSGINGDSWFDISIPNTVIDYSTYSYVLNWQPNELGSDVALLGARIYYTPPGGKAYVPAVLRDGP